MSFNASLRTSPGTVILDLSGDLDSTTAPDFRTKIQEAAEVASTRRLVIDMSQLDYMSSAGLRGLVYARQKMGTDIGLFVVGANEAVAETIRLTGFDQSLTFCDQLPE